ncbi:hypothetical protein [Streptomyces prasinopilosus]|uniref:TIGR02646 family protein n=1 Tax=Streptomyces prasinopilosus TaxID=67344 RepID=A0A1G6VX61_9ACTN|nr:hypothetical protein [Streptomyces prasinopilosus]SDD58161.1 TIGR02646 family protein [Streptomyces prasinopilosus]
MIPLRRPEADDDLLRQCAERTEQIRKLGATSKAAQSQWSAGSNEKAGIRALLFRMAPGVGRCMYCLDSLGTDIEHFEPKSRRPLRTFCWHNHLLACSHCNSNYKRTEYPCDDFGQCLLIDPSVDDPFDHLTLLPATGEFKAKTRKGRETMRVFGLNDRSELVYGRQDAYVRCCDVLLGWHRCMADGDSAGAERRVHALHREPFADVLRAVEDMARLPHASLILGSDELATALGAWLATARGTVPGERLLTTVPPSRTETSAALPSRTDG